MIYFYSHHIPYQTFVMITWKNRIMTAHTEITHDSECISDEGVVQCVYAVYV